MRLSRTLIVTAIALLSNTCQVQAQSSGAASDPLRSAVEKALLSNPDVASRFNAYRAAGDAVDVARGALRPRVDLNASVGIDKDKITSRQPESESLRLTGERSRLEAERQTAATNLRVERTARERLAMRTATPAVTMYVVDPAAQASAQTRAAPASGAQP